MQTYPAYLWAEDMPVGLQSTSLLFSIPGLLGHVHSHGMGKEHAQWKPLHGLQDTKLLPVAQICQGEDSSAIASLEHIDLSDMHIYPELWAFCDNR